MTRRDLLARLSAAGIALLDRRARLLAAAAQPATRVNFAVPTGACDCHTHIFGDPRRFPLFASRSYTPEPASVDELRRMLRALHVERVVIVQPSVYGTDNACTIDALRQLGSRGRGVAVIDQQTSDAALDDMHGAGVRGVRLNLETAGVTDPSGGRRRVEAALERVARRRWHVQVNTRPSMIAAIRDLVASSPVPFVFDHFGGAQSSLGVSQAGFEALVDLVGSGRAYVKISGAYRSSTNGPDYADAAPLARALIAANPRRVVWGTDWPHPDSVRVAGRAATDVAPLLQIDDGRLLNQLPVWAPDAATRKQILVDNPAGLYGFWQESP